MGITRSAITGPTLALTAVLLGCAGVLPARAPDWVSTHSARYPDETYLTGVGRGDTPEAAEDRAYAAISRVFSAQISQRTQEWERYLQADGPGAKAPQRSIAVDQITRVSTDKALEHVTIAERYQDPETRIHYALAIMNRKQAAATLRERISALDRDIDGLLDPAASRNDVLARVRALHMALQLLLLRDAYHTDLQIVDPSGRGAAPLTRLNTVRLELRRDLEQHVRIALDVTGDEPAAIRSALVEALNQYGLPVSDAAEDPADIMIRGTASFERVERMPQGPFIRWTARFDLLDQSTSQIIGSIQRNGREGHLTEPEAKARALRAAQRAVAEDVGRTLSAYLFGTNADPDSPHSFQEPSR